MSTCRGCGASIAVNDVACRYCGAPHPEGIAFRRAAEQHQQSELVAQATQAHYARTQAELAMRRASRHAFFWSLGALPVCCLPIPAVVAIVLGYRARKLAHQHRLDLPGQCVAAFVLGIVSFAACIALYAFIIIDSRAVDARRQQLRAEVEAAATSAALSQKTACGLVELWLLDNKFDGNTWNSSTHFDCPGKIEQKDDRATLFDVRVRRSSDQAIVAVGCLKRGARWMVEDVRRAADCAAAPKPSAAPLPAPTVKSSVR